MNSPTDVQILLIEDDVKLTELLDLYLSRNGYKVAVGHSGADAQRLLDEMNPELLILDLMLPGMDGLSICRAVRATYHGKILILTASDDDMDQVAALEMGADDYVCKPLHPRVLLARIRMLLRRHEEEPANGNTLLVNEERITSTQSRTFGQLTMVCTTKRCTLAGEAVNLTPAEFDLLWLLAQHPDQPLSREELVKQTRGIEYDGVDRTIDNRIVILRKKLQDNASQPQRIITVRGKGYLFVANSWH
ncbi:response regulator [Pontibacterium sinense]|uniref:response regulator n=1 Tax=Pontibacterium sinense TaxID=2781979 RepID=UPI003530A5B2